MIKQRIKITSESNVYVEKAFYEWKTCLNILGYLAQKENVSKETLEYYTELASQKYIALEIIKKETIESYLSGLNIKRYEFDFFNEEIIYFIDEENKK